MKCVAIRWAILLALLPLEFLFNASGAAAQKREVYESDLPSDVEDWVVEYVNDPKTIRFTGPLPFWSNFQIDTGKVTTGNIAVLRASISIAGTVEGNLVVVNGDLHFEHGGKVTGNVTVVGGRVEGKYAVATNIGGTLAVYGTSLSYVVDGRKIRLRRRGSGGSGAVSRVSRIGDTDFKVRFGRTYNRVEGLPVTFGPLFRTGGSNPLRAKMFAIWRTESGDLRDRDELGYDVDFQQFLGGYRRYSIGVRARSVIQPIEDWLLTDLENALSAFLLHRDYRDYYERRGWSGYLTAQVPSTALALRLEYLKEDHGFAPVEGPWSLRSNGEPWRPQPRVAEGELHAVEGRLTLDTRNDVEDPSTGWWIQTRVLRGVGGSLSIPRSEDYDRERSGLVRPREVDTGFTSGFLDLRRYNRAGPRTQLNLRVVLGGSLTESPLPPQFQRALGGGEGWISGRHPFPGDCGARAREVSLPSGGSIRTDLVPPYLNYGCDRIALFQMEFGGAFGWDIGIGPDNEGDWDEEDWGWNAVAGGSPRWVAFFNAGRGWAFKEGGGSDPDRPDTKIMMDLGLGFLLNESLGIYAAVPLNKDNPESDVRFFVRLDRRF